MARTDEPSAIEPRVVLRTPGMNEVLPRHDLNFLTSSATFPQGEWVLSEFGHPHQFQAAYCVRNAQGQMVRAPMPLANVSAVTNQQEIYDHCTVYHYDPTYQSPDDTEHICDTASIGREEQQTGSGLLYNDYNHQQASAYPQESDRYHIDLDIKQEIFPSSETAFLASPPPYLSGVAANAQAHASLFEKRSEIAPTSVHGSNIISFPVKKASFRYSSRPESSSVVSNFLGDTLLLDSFHNVGKEEIHSSGTFAPQDSFHTEIQAASFLSADSFDMALSPTMFSQLDESALDQLLRQRNDTKAVPPRPRGAGEGCRGSACLQITVDCIKTLLVFSDVLTAPECPEGNWYGVCMCWGHLAFSGSHLGVVCVAVAI
ncbi:hypothetical protein CH63R_09969 [Colletotrichum higginsianum IMI 349063]|uniref:Uncharacterized protein n=1 Tax=Colletotrichum higginsianum (strain IMI 349063) TaxID=759273 RepID=A0A1B7Y1G0_COLHI|nr:uncharacterized protein CH63R_09969 [Colletotrichum higginsianum IMI 349063]OBR05849.1 hypothetical protein CH63R_09969 [Colletotrichum higginsianum IMI 349063]